MRSEISWIPNAIAKHMILYAAYYSRRVDIVNHSNRKSVRSAATIVKIFTKLVAAEYQNNSRNTSIVNDSPNQRDRKVVTQNRIALKIYRREHYQIGYVMELPIAPIYPMSLSVRIVRWIVFIVAEDERAFQNQLDAMVKSTVPRDWMKKIAVCKRIFKFFSLNMCRNFKFSALFLVLVSIAPLLSELSDPKPLTPQQAIFRSDGFAIFSEKGESGKLCTEGLDTPSTKDILDTVAESLCKALGYE